MCVYVFDKQAVAAIYMLAYYNLMEKKLWI